MVGLFGIDFILQSETIWPLEVNPRYTASVEVLERASSFPAIQHHIKACRTGNLLPGKMPKCGKVFGKAILYAPQKLLVEYDLREQFGDLVICGAIETLADIPAIGTQIEIGSPVCTLITSGKSVGDVKAHLKNGALIIRGRLWKQVS